MNDTERLLSLVSDKIEQSERAYMLTNTRFLSLSERAQVMPFCKQNGAKFHFLLKV